MSKQEYNKRIFKAASEHKELIDKELSYSEDLQNKEALAQYRAGYAKVIGMLK